jgi:hypothetical protein
LGSINDDSFADKLAQEVRELESQVAKSENEALSYVEV